MRERRKCVTVFCRTPDGKERSYKITVREFVELPAPWTPTLYGDKPQSCRGVGVISKGLSQ